MGERPKFLVANSNQQSGKSTSFGIPLLLRANFLLSCLSRIREHETMGQQKQQKSDRFSCKTTTLHVYHTFLYISLPSVHDYNVKRPN